MHIYMKLGLAPLKVVLNSGDGHEDVLFRFLFLSTRLWFEEFLHLWLGIHATTAADEVFLHCHVVGYDKPGMLETSPSSPQTAYRRNYHITT